jgi:IS4 transposase
VRPTPLQPGEVEEALTRLLPSEKIEQFARVTGFVRRERKIHPIAFLWVLVLGFGVELHRHLQELKEGYVQRTGLPVSYPGFYLRFTPELSKFLKRCLEYALAELAHESGRELDPRLAAFEDIVIKDSSVVRLHASLATKWPATRSRKVAAGVKVDTLVSVRANGPKSLALVGEEPHPSLRPRLLRPPPLREDRRAGRVLRLAPEGERRPAVRRSLTVHRGQAIDLEGQRLSEVLPRLQRGILDAEVELTFKRRVYAGRRSSDTFRCRLVAVWNGEARKYHVYLTNIAPERLSAEEVATLYSLRWEIELTFKEMKSSYVLDKFRTTKVEVVEALIWSALLTLVASRRLHNLVRARQPPELRPRCPPIRWGKAFRRTAREILALLLSHLGLGARVDQRRYTRLVSVQLTRLALDPHVTRHRPRDEWST